jgi:maltose O-acetyltransferase
MKGGAMTGGSEKEKMLAGELYRASDAVLTAERLRAREALHRFNAMPPAEDDEARALLAGLFGALGEGTVVMAPFRCDYGYNVRTGRNGFLNHDCVFLDCAPIAIGDDAQIGPGVHVYTATHPVEPETRRSGVEYALPVTIEDNVWLGGGTIVCPGVTIGRDTVVGAGSVVTRPLPPGVVAAGNPCRVLRPL